MAYQRRRYNSGGGKGGSIFTRLFAGGDTAEANEPNVSFDPLLDEGLLQGGDFSEGGGPGSVPFQYRGNPEELLGRGGYVAPTSGRFSPQPYSDIRSWGNRVIGQEPNTAEALNLEAAQAGLLGRQATTEKLALERGMLPIEAERGLNTLAGQLGITRDQLLTLSPDKLAALQEGMRALASTSRATGAQQETARLLAEGTRNDLLRAGVADASTGAIGAERRMMLANTPMGQEAFDAGQLASLLTPVSGLQKAGTVNVGPGELSVIPGMDRLLGPSLQGLIPSGGEARGTTIGEEPITQQIGNQAYNVGTRRSVNPASFNRIVPTSIEEINMLKGSRTSGASPSMDIGPLLSQPPTTNPQLGPIRFQGGNVVSDVTQVETPEAKLRRQQLEAQQAMEIIRQILSQPNISPNRKNF